MFLIEIFPFQFILSQNIPTPTLLEQKVPLSLPYTCVTFGVYTGLAGLLMVILLWVLPTKCHLR